jgi:hypothetical protein
MHPAISHDLAQAHVADLRHRAQRDTLARAARLARRNQPGPALSRLGAGGGPAQAGLMARITLDYQRRRDSRVARIQRPIPTRIKEARPHCGPPDPNSGRAGDCFAFIPAVGPNPIRAYPILSSPTEEGHAHNPE